MDQRKLIESLIKIFFWHPVVQEFMIEYLLRHYHTGIDKDKGKRKSDNDELMAYIKEHGNSIWAKIDVKTAAIRLWILVIIFIFAVVLSTGYRPWEFWK